MNSEEYNQILKQLEEAHPCFVLVVCDGPDQIGNMQVKMDYQGDPVLASLLLQGASDTIDEDIASLI